MSTDVECKCTALHLLVQGCSTSFLPQSDRRAHKVVFVHNQKTRGQRERRDNAETPLGNPEPQPIVDLHVQLPIGARQYRNSTSG